MSMDMTQSIEPRSDQINSDDLIAGPITYTIREVVKGVAEPPFDFALVETERAYRPSKTMRRVIVAAWGAEAANYAGRRLTLYREPTITFGGKTVGGIRISAMSHIAGPVEVMAQTTRGKRETFTVQPLPNLALNAPGTPEPAEPNRSVGAPAAEGEQAFSAGTTTTTGGGAESGTGASQSEAATPAESLLDAITRQIAEIIEEGGGPHMKTWWAELGIGSSKRALVDRFGEEARDLRKLMGSPS